MARAGRRPGVSTTAEDVLGAARSLFAARGFQATTIRAVAAQAGVNPALVHHYFGDKEQLFLAAMDLPVSPDVLLAAVLAGPREQVPQRLVRTFLRIWADPVTGPRALGVLRAAATTEQSAMMLRRFAEEVALARLSPALGVPKPRVAAAAAHMVGVAFAIHIARIEPLASLSEDELVELLTPAIATYVGAPS